MNSVHLHLVVNHFPFFGMLFSLLFFIFTHMRPQDELRKYSYIFTFIISMISIFVYWTGTPAMSYIHFMPGFSAQAIESHIQSARISLFSLHMLNISILILLFFVFRNKKAPNAFIIFKFIALIIALITLGYVTHTGGKIRHPEAIDGFSHPIENQQELPVHF